MKRRLLAVWMLGVLAFATAAWSENETPTAVAAPAVVPPSDKAAEAGRLLRNGLASYRALSGYQARMREETQKNGRLKTTEMFLRHDKQPETILLKYTGGSKATLQVLYSKDRFDGKLMTRPPGLFFEFIPIIAMSPDDPRVKGEESRPITSAGIGYMIEQLSEEWAEAEANGQAGVLSVTQDQVLITGPNAEPAAPTTRLDFRIDSPGESHPRKVLHFRKSDGLPIRLELYKPDSQTPDETYTYYAIVTNPAKNDPAFVKLVDRRLLELYNKI